MNISFGKGKTEFGTGIQIDLKGEEVVMAIYAYLMAHNVVVDGAATLRVNGKRIESGEVYVDPSGRVIENGEGWNGRGYKES